MALPNEYSTRTKFKINPLEDLYSAIIGKLNHQQTSNDHGSSVNIKLISHYLWTQNCFISAKFNRLFSTCYAKLLIGERLAY